MQQLSEQILWGPLKNDSIVFPHLSYKPEVVPKASVWIHIGSEVGGPGVAEAEAEDSFCQKLARSLQSRISDSWRDTHGRSREELMELKERVKSLLRRYDKTFIGRFQRPPSRQEKEPMRAAYELYRQLKAAAQRQAVSNGGSEAPQGGGVGATTELQIRLNELLVKKAQLGRQLQAFADAFERKNSRKVKYAKDIQPVDEEYKLYKQIKSVTSSPWDWRHPTPWDLAALPGIWDWDWVGRMRHLGLSTPVVQLSVSSG
ncbi:hypothetical protein GNI_186750 [Gregarina niphandrodes]|uniref:FAM13A-like domain-containing protein n=1 Tax=Gregarina niphandrodes TaxID=110365 RepID=A0A023AX11_GRENI|nr:hypothetical protein GNI_186750 [Gregarina niphandrodes]EZG43122.1 hypothetical protein GNI_186750 [Gregarina niphandrodes]|eukprot:XP_011133622.1 hypothetical protein GNI_186750 [Gregarina niphandrodes]